MAIIVTLCSVLFSHQTANAWGYKTEENDKTLDGVPTNELDQKIKKIIEALPQMPQGLKNAMPRTGLKEWDKHLANLISGLIPRQYHYYGSSERSKEVYLVWYCLSPQEALPDELEKDAKGLIIQVLKTDWLGNLTWKWLKPAMRKGFLLLDEQEQSNIREYLAHAKKTIRPSNFYSRESNHWQNSLNRKTCDYDFQYNIMSDTSPELKKYIGTAAYEFIIFNPSGQKRGEFAKLEIWLFRRIHFDGVKPYQLKRWITRMESISKAP